MGRLPQWLRKLFSIAPDPVEQMRALPEERRRVVVGLGNPGRTYEKTRHNVGFLCVDRLAQRSGARWRDDRQRTTSQIALTHGDAVDVLLVKPLTFMNTSGEAVARLVSLSGVAPEHVLVVYDDMDLPFGSLRLRERGSAGTHNGLKSIVSLLGTDEIPRLRLGIAQDRSVAARDYVLSPFQDAEAERLPELLDRAADAVRVWAEQGAPAAMNQFNRG